MKISESYKNRLGELAGTKILAESSIVTDKLNSLTFKKDVESIGGKIYGVGGAVRDEILGKPSKDLDILITGVPLDRLEHILIKHGTVKDVGKSFGIIKFIPFGETEDIDIAIPRLEKKIGTGYHGFEVTSDHTLPIESDLKRRDYSLNSLAKDVSGNIIDPFGGVEDLKNKILRVTNENSFGDDPLRMLRGVQLAARFGFTIEPNTMALIKMNAHKIKEIAPERFIIEFDKIIKKGNPQVGMDILIDSGLFKEMFGFEYAGDRDFSKVKTMADLIYKLLEGSGKVASDFCIKNLTNESSVVNQIKALELQEQLSGDKLEDRKIVQKIINISSDIEQSGLLKEDTKSIIKTFVDGKYPLNIKDLEINGNDLMAMGYKNAEIGKKNNLIMQAVLSDEIPNKKEDIRKFLEDMRKSENPEPKKEDKNNPENPESINSINETRKIVRNVLFENFFTDKSADYKKWKRKNVTIRGMKSVGVPNDAGGMLGQGLYSAALSNKELAKQYGNVYFVVNAKPKHPIQFNTLNDWEIWFYNTLVYKYSKAQGKDYPDKRDFNTNTTIEDEVQKMGYDGIEIKGREMVNFKPENIQYFKTERELIDYYENSVQNNIQENFTQHYPMVKKEDDLNRFVLHISPDSKNESEEDGSIMLSSTPNKDGFVLLGGIIINEKLRNKGLGEFLMIETLKQLKNNNIKGILSSGGSRTEAAEKMWERLKKRKDVKITEGINQLTNRTIYTIELI